MYAVVVVILYVPNWIRIMFMNVCEKLKLKIMCGRERSDEDGDDDGKIFYWNYQEGKNCEVKNIGKKIISSWFSLLSLKLNVNDHKICWEIYNCTKYQFKNKELLIE